MSNPSSLFPRRVASLGISLALCLGVTALPSMGEAAPKSGLIGKWQAEAQEIDGKRYPVKPPMKIVFAFLKGGKVQVTVTLKDETKKQEGTYKVEGKKLTMSVEGKTEEMTYSISGSDLRLEKSMGGRTMLFFMKRIK